MKTSLIAAATVLLIGCSDNRAAPADTAAVAGGTSAAAVTQQPAQQPVVALGLTMEQLEDADLIDASGREIGEVERVMTAAGGSVTGLLIEIEDTDPDRYVTIPLDGLTVVQDGHDQDLRGTMTREQLMTMPETRR